MPFRLALRSGEDVHLHALRIGENLLGSDPSCEVVLEDPTVSRHHASLLVIGGDNEPERVELADLGSRNGTWVDLERVDGKTEIGAGVVVRFGSVEGRLENLDVADLQPYAPEGTDPSRPRDTGGSPSKEGHGVPPSRAAGTTASVGPLSLFTLGQLPLLMEHLEQGLPPHALATRAGEAMLASLPIQSLEIGRRIEQRVLHWFDHRPQDVQTSEDECLVHEKGDIEIRVCFDDARSARLLLPVVDTVASMLAVAQRASRASRGEKTNGDATSEGTVDNVTPQSAARPPDPPSLDARFRTLYERAARVARGDVNVLIEGESGTGKELLARFLHDSSPRRDGAFVALNCAALPRDLQETELFGIEQGVATGVEARPGKFELANGGTLFLDEIGDMAPAVQAKILRVLQEGEIYRIGGSRSRPARARIVSATHRNVKDLVASGDFRSDLFHRIADWRARLPTLRERSCDIPNLVLYFLREAEAREGAVPLEVSQGAMAALESYGWPGNVRQLEREVLSARLFVDPGGLLDTLCLSEEVLAGSPDGAGASFKDELQRFEASLLRTRLQEVGGDVNALSESLDVPLSTLYRKLKTHDLS